MTSVQHKNIKNTTHVSFDCVIVTNRLGYSRALLPMPVAIQSANSLIVSSISQLVQQSFRRLTIRQSLLVFHQWDNSLCGKADICSETTAVLVTGVRKP